MAKITLIGIDTAKSVFHLVGVDAHGHYTWRKRLSRQRLLPNLAQMKPTPLGDLLGFRIALRRGLLRGVLAAIGAN
jgi:hypothetical protein